MIEYRKHITRKDLQNEPDKVFVFGDNLQRRGLGGQAREMRGEPNAVGIPTKKAPSMAESSFFTDKDYEMFRQHVKPNVDFLLAFDGTIVWPQDGIGTGLAQLPERASKIWEYIENLRIMLEER